MWAVISHSATKQDQAWQEKKQYINTVYVFLVKTKSVINRHEQMELFAGQALRYGTFKLMMLHEIKAAIIESGEPN